MEEYRGKGSFPAMITPAYLSAKKANDMASDVSIGVRENFVFCIFGLEYTNVLLVYDIWRICV